MSLPHVLLGLLTEGPRTGYELERVLREELEPVWRAELSQIYPALSGLRRAGFVVLRILGPRRGPRRHLYRATAAGRRELKRWLAESSAPLRGKDEVLVRVALLEALAPEERRDAIAKQERIVTEEIARLRLAPMPRGFRREARRGALEKLEATRRWLHALAYEPNSPVAQAPTHRTSIHKRK